MPSSLLLRSPCLWAVCLVFLFGTGAALAKDPKPDIILIVADNLGHGDLSCYGCRDIKTPNIDRLAGQGVRFTNFYANGPECSPTRTALLTGRYQQRLLGLECALGTGNVGRYDDAIALADRHQLGLPPDESILAPALKKAGYRTIGIGKWHLGYEPHLLPPHHGFDYFLASLGGTIDYFYHNEPTGEPVLYENLKPARRDKYFTDLITETAVDFLKKQPAEEPIFLYLPYTAPSAPFQDPDQMPREPKVSKTWDSKDWQKGDRKTLRKIIERLDQGVGRVLETLESTGRAKNALVIFSSDNGAYPIAASNSPFRGHASELFEGGIHVAAMARRPGKIQEGLVDDRLMMTFDLTASILAAAGASPPKNRPLDGIDILGQIAAGEPAIDRTLFWRARRADRTWRAVREQNLKYISRQDGEQTEEYLFDLAKDPGETRNLFASHPAAVNSLKQKLARWENQVRPTGDNNTSKNSARADEAAALRRRKSQEFSLRSQQRTGVLVPMYVYPGNFDRNPAFTRLIEIKRRYETVPMWVIVNPASGPGQRVDDNYTRTIHRLRGAGIVVLGYVTTSYANRSAADVENEIDRWLSLYPHIHGIFFDEMIYEDTESGAEYQAALNRYAHNAGCWPTVANPGADTPGRYFAAEAADVILIHEGKSWPSEDRLKGTALGYADHPPFTRGLLVHSQSALDRQAVETARKYVRWIYSTEAPYRPGDPTAANAWDRLSRHLEELCEVLSEN